MDYTALTPEQQANMLTARLQRYEQQHYDTSLNLALIPGTADENDETLEQLRVKIADLEKSIVRVRQMLAALPQRR